MAESPLSPHPGPAPDPFEFPFVAAKDALAELDDAVAVLRTGVERHARASSIVMDGFEGRTADEFRAALAGQLDAIDDHIATLNRLRDDLEDDIAAARRRQETAIEARADWSQRMDSYEAAVETCRAWRGRCRRARRSPHGDRQGTMFGDQLGGGIQDGVVHLDARRILRKLEF